MTTTTSSSTANALDGVAPEHIALVLKACNVYSAACAKALQATNSYSQQVRSGITAAIEIHRPQLDVLSHRDRTGFLMERLEANFKKYGLKRAPDRETVKDVVDTAFKIDADS